MKSIKYLYLLAFSLFVVASCNNDPEIENPEELITDMVVTLTPTNGGDVQRLVFNDEDGEGGMEATILGATLIANAIYDVEITLSGVEEMSSEKEDITAEILAEADEHQFFYSAPDLDFTFEYLDSDGANLPLGQKFRLDTGDDLGMGNLTITLLHMPKKSAARVADGEITNAEGETDIQVPFLILISE